MDTLAAILSKLNRPRELETLASRLMEIRLDIYNNNIQLHVLEKKEYNTNSCNKEILLFRPIFYYHGIRSTLFIDKLTQMKHMIFSFAGYPTNETGYPAGYQISGRIPVIRPDMIPDIKNGLISGQPDIWYNLNQNWVLDFYTPK